MKKTIFLLSAALALTTTTVALAQHGGSSKGDKGGKGGKGGPTESARIGGVVSALAADGSSFTLTVSGGKTVTVNVGAKTTITNESDKSAATLADGQEVDVTGSFDTTGKIFTATAVVVDDQNPEPRNYFGAISALAADGSSFTLTGPKSETATVNVGAKTVVTNLTDGSAATLANGQKVLVTGVIDSTGKIITASAIVVDDRKPKPYTYFGAVSALAADGSSFTLTGEHKKTATVNVTSATTITNYSNGSAATLANGQNVAVTGTVDSTGKVITASAIVVDDRKPPVKLQSAEGTILSLDATSQTFVLTVKHSNLKPTGATITVIATAATVYSGKKGVLTFADLTAGAVIEVAGAFDAATQTLTATRIEIEK